ncbi:hypothetical protein DMC64_20025 [Amycolatopsis sp. WAC 04197]|uniref:pilus assembly protein TadG-related protein n=1 Tax=Amycolatopsis sp. WAC 04197 TaxID=2203199 RepID=UPI000F79CB39|nr:pilus assembly protein TadG-related protein [Amycolatopsis sp. WAC 04197]RSN45132.1 hypothetical protein DMC64_20025 [Amycolatopsis sp. WAC 04197]
MTGERGSISVWLVALSLALIIAIGWAVDGSRKALAHSEATSVAEEAARAAGQALRLQALTAGQVAEVTPHHAIDEAERYLATAGVTGTVAVQGNRIVVDITISKTTIFLDVIGISEFTVHGHGVADLLSEK